MDVWFQRFETEIARGEAARQAGNEGMARVCARRAAGIAIDEYLARHNLTRRGPSAYDSIRYLLDLPGMDDTVLEVAGHLLARITPDKTLPVEADLLAEARWLRSRLLGE